jgi:hypothetical protein
MLLGFKRRADRRGKGGLANGTSCAALDVRLLPHTLRA